MTSAQRKELPKAVRNSLNDTAFDVRKFVVQTLWPRSFPRARNPKFAKAAFNVKRSDPKTLKAIVFDRLDKEIFRRTTTGSVRRARKGNLAIPETIRGNVKIGQRGPTKANRPANIKNAIVLDLKGRGEAIYKQTKDGLKLMYVLKPTATQAKNFEFYKFAGAKARQRFPKHIKREVPFAIKRAERKIKGAK